MKHQLEDIPGQEGLTQCSVCLGAEGALPSECPGEEMEGAAFDLVYCRAIDYRNGAWITLDTDALCPECKKTANEHGSTWRCPK